MINNYRTKLGNFLRKTGQSLDAVGATMEAHQSVEKCKDSLYFFFC